MVRRILLHPVRSYRLHVRMLRLCMRLEPAAASVTEITNLRKWIDEARAIMQEYRLG